MRPDDLSLLRLPSAPSAAPDGRWAVFALAHPDLDEDTYPSRLWRIELPSGATRPLTFGFRDSDPVVSPDGKYIAFLRALKGKAPQLALMRSDGGEPWVLTDHPLGVGGKVEFSPDSSRVVYIARVPEEGRYGTTEGVGPGDEAPRHITTFTYRIDGAGFYTDRPAHVFVLDVPVDSDPAQVPSSVTTTDDDGESGKVVKPAREGVPVAPQQLSTSDAGYSSPSFTHDGTGVLAARSIPDALHTEHVLIDVASGDENVLDLPQGRNFSKLNDAPDALWMLDADLGESNLDFIGKTPALNRATRQGTTVTDVQQLTDPTTVSLNGGVFTVDEQGVLLANANRGAVELLRYADGALNPVFDGQVSVIGAAALPDGGVLVSAATTESSGELFLVTDTARQLTNFAAPAQEQAPAIVPSELTVSSDDDYPVHGWVTVPDGEGPHPVLLLIHGGPFAQYQPTFFDEVQVYTRAGYAVVFCNPRGSLGYGPDHGRAITGGFGDRDAADVLAFLDGALAAHASLDSERVGVLGGSYGGYMTAWLTTRTDRFVAAIVERGFLDPVSFEGSSDIGWFFGLQYLGTDPQKVAAQNPMAHIDQVSTPTLVIHSENDWRCPVEQGQRWYVGLKRRGVESELLLFPGEGHELSRAGRPKHRLARFEHILKWWDKHLPVDGTEGDGRGEANDD